jgi:hypothetical protein
MISTWKVEAIPLNYTRKIIIYIIYTSFIFNIIVIVMGNNLFIKGVKIICFV